MQFGGSRQCFLFALPHLGRLTAVFQLSITFFFAVKHKLPRLMCSHSFLWVQCSCLSFFGFVLPHTWKLQLLLQPFIEVCWSSCLFLFFLKKWPCFYFFFLSKRVTQNALCSLPVEFMSCHTPQWWNLGVSLGFPELGFSVCECFQRWLLKREVAVMNSAVSAGTASLLQLNVFRQTGGFIYSFFFFKFCRNEGSQIHWDWKPRSYMSLIREFPSLSWWLFLFFHWDVTRREVGSQLLMLQLYVLTHFDTGNEATLLPTGWWWNCRSINIRDGCAEA